MEETLAELFACHLACGGFEGNLPKAFSTFIAGEEYGPDETPDVLRLYGGWYTMMFRPGESLCAVFVQTRSNAYCGCVPFRDCLPVL